MVYAVAIASFPPLGDTMSFRVSSRRLDHMALQWLLWSYWDRSLGNTEGCLLAFCEALHPFALRIHIPWAPACYPQSLGTLLQSETALEIASFPVELAFNLDSSIAVIYLTVYSVIGRSFRGNPSLRSVSLMFAGNPVWF